MSSPPRSEALPFKGRVGWGWVSSRKTNSRPGRCTDLYGWLLLRRRLLLRRQFLEIRDHALQRIVQLPLARHQVIDLRGLLQLRQFAVEQQPRRRQRLHVVAGVV